MDPTSEESFAAHADRQDRWINRPIPSSCPECGAQYPDYHSPPGDTGTFCDSCGHASGDTCQRHEGGD